MRCSRTPERRRAWRVAALMATLAGCARAPAPEPAPPGDALAIVRARAAAVRTLRAQFDVAVHLPSGQHRASGVLLVRPPDDARMRLVAPFGLTVFDALRTGGRTYVNAPLSSDHDEASLAFLHVGPGDSLIFGADAGSCRSAGTRAGGVEYWCGTPPNRWVSIDAATATVRAEGELQDGIPVVTWTYADYRVVDGTPLPFRIGIAYPRLQVTVSITVTRYEVNPALRDDQFAPPPAQTSSIPLVFGLVPCAVCLLPRGAAR